MLTQFKNCIEGKMGSEVTKEELLVCINKAKDDIVFNRLVFAQDITHNEFEDVVVNCINARRKHEANLLSRR